jgi:hypothetical protein
MTEDNTRYHTYAVAWAIPIAQAVITGEAWLHTQGSPYVIYGG